MNNLHHIIDRKHKHNSLHTDYKAEVIALNLIKYYEEVDQVFLKRLGSNNRSFNKDLEDMSCQVHDFGEVIVSLFSFREGLYDYLPEGLFHAPSLGNHKTGIDEIIGQIQKQKKIEIDARNFFQPFELEPYFLELHALAKENEFEITDPSELLLELFKELWPLLEALDKDTSKIFVYLLPFFSAVKGNKEWFGKCLKAFLQIPVQISFTANRVNDVSTAGDMISLSNFHLGISTVLNGEHLDGERNWAIHFGPISYENIAHYVPCSNLRKLLELLYNYCLPATMKVEEHFVLEKNPNSFLLDKSQDTSRLGYSTFL